MSNIFSNAIKSVSGSTQRQKLITRSFLYSIIAISAFLVAYSFLVNVSNINKYTEVIKKGTEIDSKIVMANLNIKSIDMDMVESNKIISEEMLFHNISDISYFIDNSISAKVEKDGYIVQFKVLKTKVDNEFGIFKTTVDFEFINVNSSGDGYNKMMRYLNDIFSNSDKKVDMSKFVVHGNFNDVSTINVSLDLWCDFKYEYK